MTQNEKELLLEDLCSRLPYSVKIQDSSYQNPLKVISINPNPDGETWAIGDKGYPIEIDWEDCKPYLFPLSSMTEEQRLKTRILTNGTIGIDQDSIWDITGYGELNIKTTLELIQWLYKSHFDINGLIKKGLAIDCTNLNIY